LIVKKSVTPPAISAAPVSASHTPASACALLLSLSSAALVASGDFFSVPRAFDAVSASPPLTAAPTASAPVATHPPHTTELFGGGGGVTSGPPPALGSGCGGVTGFCGDCTGFTGVLGGTSGPTGGVGPVFVVSTSSSPTFCSSALAISTTFEAAVKPAL